MQLGLSKACERDFGAIAPLTLQAGAQLFANVAPTSLFVRQLAEQRLDRFEVERIEAFGEPAVDRSKKIAGPIRFALIAPEPR